MVIVATQSQYFQELLQVLIIYEISFGLLEEKLEGKKKEKQCALKDDVPC